MKSRIDPAALTRVQDEAGERQNPYRASPNPQPMLGEVRKHPEQGHEIGPEPFFRVGDHVKSRYQGKTGVVSDVIPRLSGTEWNEWLIVNIEKECRRPGGSETDHALAQHYDLVERKPKGEGDEACA